MSVHLPIARGVNRLASYDADALADLLVKKTQAPLSTAQAAAGRAIKLAFSRARSASIVWDDATLAAATIGAWARPTLLALDTTTSLVISERAPSSDGATRLLLKAEDGALVESVIIPGPRRTTLCVSSQVGCARACRFCETGRNGLERQLSAAEIIDQVRLARAIDPSISNLVFMGMGEPFDNLPEVLRSIRLLTDSRAFAFAPSRITVSTVGVADKIAPFFAGCRAELAVSLNAPDDVRRSAIMPVNDRVPLAALCAAIAKSLPPGRRVFFEYVLFDSVNDAPEDADLLANLVRDLRCRVNVIPCNPGPDPSLRPPTVERLEAFVARLSSLGITTLVRRPRGRDVGGACGQLRADRMEAT
jgi:23S rRNA (adenine2503-C2)-methyltransferase